MTYLSAQQEELVAIGASLGSNCIPCIKFHVQKGREVGLSDEVIGKAIEVADRVRQVPARKVLEAAMAVLGRDSTHPQDAKGAATCGAVDAGPSSKGTAGSPCCGPEAGP